MPNAGDMRAIYNVAIGYPGGNDLNIDFIHYVIND
jgi:hypothetical protein